jgi:hypothetical protein
MVRPNELLVGPRHRLFPSLSAERIGWELMQAAPPVTFRHLAGHFSRPKVGFRRMARVGVM